MNEAEKRRRVVLAGDDVLLREGLASLLERSSWRIPPAALRRAGLGKALEPDSVAAELAAAEALVESLLAELSDAAQRKRPPLVARDWRSVAASARRLATASRRLHELAGAAHQRFGT
jgi:hypothetical protein